METILTTFNGYFMDSIDTVLRDDFLEAIWTTIYISSLSSLLAMLIGFLMAFASMTSVSVFGVRFLQWVSRIYVEVFRNTPLLIQLYLYYRGLQSLGIILEPVTCGILGLSLYTGAYLTEVFRSGLLAVPHHQLDAGLALGLGRFRVYFLILIPQAVRIILPALTNQWINLMKNSSLVAFITVSDIFYMVYVGAVQDFKPLKFFIIGAALYVTLTLVIATVVQILDWLLETKKLRFPVLIQSQDLVAEGHSG